MIRVMIKRISNIDNNNNYNDNNNNSNKNNNNNHIVSNRNNIYDCRAKFHQTIFFVII